MMTRRRGVSKSEEGRVCDEVFPHEYALEARATREDITENTFRATDQPPPSSPGGARAQSGARSHRRRQRGTCTNVPVRR